MVISAVPRGIQLAKRLYGYSQPLIKGESFVTRFPPKYRGDVRTIIKGSEIAFSGGLVADIARDLSQGDNSNYGIPSKQPFKANRFKKGRSGRFRRYTRKYRNGNIQRKRKLSGAGCCCCRHS